MANRPVSVRILHPEPGPDAGPIERWVGASRATLADRHRTAFLDAGATDAIVLSGPPDDTPFGARLRAIVRADRPAGLVVLGSGAMPLATGRDYRDLVAAAGADGRTALANNRYSADVVAVARAEALADLPDLPGDNALPRWLEETAGFVVADLRHRWRLAADVDGPLDLVLLGGVAVAPPGIDLRRVREALGGVRAVGGDLRAELVVAGRVSVSTVAWLERGIPARVRAIIEERGLRAATRLAQAPSSGSRERPPASLLGELLERDGPDAIGTVLGRLGDAAVIDTRVLLAHRLGASDAAWPPPEDRFASDLLLPDRIGDPWLRELTTAAAEASLPILLGGHSLVGPGLRLLLGRPRRRGLPWT
jgi:hypothetical protein